MSVGRDRRRPPPAMWLPLVLLAAMSAGCARRPLNVILISVDTLRRDALPTYSGRASELPVLDALAGRSVVFDRALSTAPWTLPAHASMLTGLYPDRHGAIHHRTALLPQVPTLAERLRDAGYVTVAFTDGVYLARFRLARGFARYDEWTDGEARRLPRSFPRGGAPAAHPGERLFDRGIAFLEEWPGGSPGFFLFLHTYVVHDYFLVHPWAVRVLPPCSRDDPTRYRDCLLGEVSCSDADWTRLESLYAAEVRWLDQGLGRLLAELSRRGLDRSTVVVLVSDHGEGFAPARGRIHHGGRVDADLLRIPMLVAAPGIAPGRRQTPVSLVDVMPSVLELCGLRPVPDLDGTSVVSVLRGGDTDQERWLYAMEHCFWWQDGERRDLPAPPQRPLATAVVHGDEWYEADSRSERLYDLGQDPGQLHDLAAEHPAQLAALRDRLSGRPVESARGPEVEMDRRTEDRLRTLGYLH